MNNRFYRRLFGTLCAALLLGACAGTYPATDSADDALPACTAKGTPFENAQPFAWSGNKKSGWGVLTWSDTYHAQVSAVIEEYRTTIGVGAEKNDGMPTADTILQCTGQDYRDVVPAGPFLASLAQTLQPWKNAAAGRDATSLSAADAGSVLLEYLREYECALREHDLNVRDSVSREMNTLSTGKLRFAQNDLSDETTRRQERIKEELRVARPALERTLLLLSGAQRLHPIIADMECIERASLDLRNAFSLLTGAASCMGRTVDARSPLRF